MIDLISEEMERFEKQRLAWLAESPRWREQEELLRAAPAATCPVQMVRGRGRA